MKLAYADIEPLLNFEENNAIALVLENTGQFRNFVFDLHGQLENKSEKMVLSDKNKTMPWTKNVGAAFSLEDLNINNKKSLAKLYEKLVANATAEDLYPITLQLRQQINNYAFELLQSEQLPLFFNTEFSLQELLKAIDIKFESDMRDIGSNIANFIDVQREFLNVKLLVLVNLKSYFTTDELEDIYRHAEYRNLHLLLVENHMSEKIKGEKLVLIDKDLCLVYN